MKCSLCGMEFDKKNADLSCGKCVYKKNCRLIRCPNCGYETPETPRWIKKITDKFRRIKK